MASSEETGILVFVLAASLLLILLVVACCHRYYKLKQMRATAAMLPDWDGHQQLNDQPAVGPAYMPAPASGNFQPLPNVLYTGTPYHHPLPAHVQFYQQQHQQQQPAGAMRVPNASDRQDHLNATPGAFQLNQQAAMATPNVVGCFYGAAYVPNNPYGPTNYGLIEPTVQQQHIETALIHNGQDAMHNALTSPGIAPQPPSYDQAMYVKPGLTAVSD